MPTVVLLDVSNAAAAPVGGESTSVRLDLMQRGVLKFLADLTAIQKGEQVALVTFAEQGAVLQPFTSDAATLNKHLYSCVPDGSASLARGLETMCALVEERYGSGTPVQALVVSTAPSFDVDAVLRAACVFPVRVHALVFGLAAECARVDMAPLVRAFGGHAECVVLPGGTSHYRDAFARVLEGHYGQWSGWLHFGHLRDRVALRPEPQLSLFHVLGTSSYPSKFPEVVSVVGFYAVEHLPSPPVLARHVIADAGGATDDISAAIFGGPGTSDVSGGGGALRPLLAHTLDMIHTGNNGVAARQGTEQPKGTPGPRLCALVRLAEQWYGSVASAPAAEADSVQLVLSVFPLGMELPWMGPLGELEQYKFDPAAMGEQMKRVWIPAAQEPQYQAKSASHCAPITQDSFRSMHARLQKFSLAMPGREAALCGELEKVRVQADTLCMPGLMDSAMEAMLMHSNELSGSARKALLRIVRVVNTQPWDAPFDFE